MTHLLLIVIYLSFISLGLPDSLLGAAWPTMQLQLQVPVSYAGMISMIIAAGTIVSSLQSERLTNRLGSGRVTAISVGITAAALFGFSISRSFWELCLWAVPYGLGAGSVDASLNNYVALHYKSRHMSWLHCMWGVGASVGPYIMGFVMSGGKTWSSGYRAIAMIQIGLTLILVFSLPLWKSRSGAAKDDGTAKKPLPLRTVVGIRGVKEVLVAFFCYCALEQTAGLWASSYLTLYKGVEAEQAAFFASMFFIGISVGRAANGFLTIRFSDTAMIRLGEGVIGFGILIMLLPFSATASLAGFIIIGLGCAPIYPCIIHATPGHFGADRSQAVIGVQMASAYVGTCIMPPIFGLIADHISVSLLPFYLLAILLLMAWMHETMLRKLA